MTHAFCAGQPVHSWWPRIATDASAIMGSDGFSWRRETRPSADCASVCLAHLGQVLGTRWRIVRAVQGSPREGWAGKQRTAIAEKTCKQALFLRPSPAAPMVRRGSAVRVRQRALRVPANQLLSFAAATTRRWLDVHRASTARRDRLKRCRESVAATKLFGLPGRRPPSVHRAFERERVEERDGVLAAVVGEVAVVVVDHRDA